MFATAAVVDAKMKAKRLEDWDRAIEQVKGTANTAEEGDGDSLNRSQIHTTSTIKAVRPDDWTKILAENIYTPLKTTAKSETYRACANWYKNEVITPPRGQSTFLEERLKVIAKQVTTDIGQFGRTPEAKLGPAPIERNPTTDEHIKRMGEMMSRMILKLRKFAAETTEKRLTRGEEKLSPELEKQFRDMRQRFFHVDHEAVIYPNYSLDFTYTKKRLALNHTLLSLLKQQEMPMDLMIAKIAFNLMITPAAPDITTFNLLILHFTHLEQYDVAKMVIDTFFNESKLKPNESTIVALLEHYTASNDKEGFKMLVRRMNGTRGDMRLKRRTLWHLRLPEVQEWALNNKVIHRNFHIHEKVVRTQAIFNSLIVGAYKFFGLRQAMLYIRAALREGYRLHYWIFEFLANNCFLERNVKQAEDLLRLMLSQWTEVPKLGPTSRQWLARLVAFSRDASNLADDQLVQRYGGYEALFINLMKELKSPMVPDPLEKLPIETQVDRAATVTKMLARELDHIDFACGAKSGGNQHSTKFEETDSQEGTDALCTMHNSSGSSKESEGKNLPEPLSSQSLP